MTSKSNQQLVRHATLRQLQIFEVVARHENFTKAGEELHLTQPSVSAQIKKLTDAVGLPLFEQIGRNVYLTDAGKLVARSCRDVLDELANLEMSIAELKGMRRGRLRLGVITAAKYFAPLALGRFCKQYSDIEIELTVTNKDKLLQRIAHNLDDIYILGAIPPTDQDLEVIPFAPNPLVVIAPEGHPLATEQPVHFAQFAEQPLIMREQGSGVRAAVEKRFREHGLSPRVRLALENDESIKQAVVGELGLAVISQHALNQDRGCSGIVALDVEGFPMERYWNIVYPRGKVLSVVAGKFLEYLKSHADDLVFPGGRRDAR
ncbi:MAG: LysR substrate-binding domain-containing protein [Halothiobacillaceae bacterium]